MPELSLNTRIPYLSPNHVNRRSRHQVRPEALGLYPYRLCHPSPTKILLTFQPAQVGGGDGEGTVIEEA